MNLLFIRENMQKRIAYLNKDKINICEKLNSFPYFTYFINVIYKRFLKIILTVFMKNLTLSLNFHVFEIMNYKLP